MGNNVVKLAEDVEDDVVGRNSRKEQSGEGIPKRKNVGNILKSPKRKRKKKNRENEVPYMVWQSDVEVVQGWGEGVSVPYRGTNPVTSSISQQKTEEKVHEGGRKDVVVEKGSLFSIELIEDDKKGTGVKDIVEKYRRQEGDGAWGESDATVQREGGKIRRTVSKKKLRAGLSGHCGEEC